MDDYVKKLPMTQKTKIPSVYILFIEIQAVFSGDRRVPRPINES
jgi:hypothetical protein